MALRNARRAARLRKERSTQIPIFILLIAVVFVFTCNISFAAEKSPRYQVFTGSNENAYLIDTRTGFVWILTYRTLAAGREPIAVPYKFIKISPNNQKEFIVEDAPAINGAH